MTIYLMFPEFIWNTLSEKFFEASIEVTFDKCHLENSHFHRDKSEGQLFDVFCDCNALVVMPYQSGILDDKQLFAGKVFEALKKPIYLLNPEGLTICASHQLQTKELTNGQVPKQ